MNHWKRTLSALLVGGALCGSYCSAEAADQSKVIRDDNWKIEIRPANRGRIFDQSVIPASNEEAPAPESQAAPKPETPAPTANAKPIGPPEAPLMGPTLAPHMSFAEAYRAIPFSRTEYMANPGYRQQAAMELMFGVLRPMTMVNQYSPRPYRYPDTYQYPYARSDAQHINLRTFNSGYNFNGQSPFGYPYGLGGNW